MSHDPHPISGLWQPIKAELSGDAAPEMVLKRMTLRFHSDRYVVHFGGEISDEGLYELTTGELHAQLTLTGKRGTNRGKTIPAIFQLVGDRLRICYGLDGKRPVAFATSPNAPHYLVTYRRKTN